jgi:uncharacterized repeat protein (TIGR03803 family)
MDIQRHPLLRPARRHISCGRSYRRSFRNSFRRNHQRPGVLSGRRWVGLHACPGGAGWTENIICSFAGQYGGGPYASLSLDAHGNLYGTTFKDGPLGFGNVFRLNPSGGGCAYAPLHDFDYYNDGAYPMSTVLFDSEGNLFGTTSFAGPGGHGTVWEITP